jgi:hypothetical protein
VLTLGVYLIVGIFISRDKARDNYINRKINGGSFFLDFIQSLSLSIGWLPLIIFEFSFKGVRTD